MITRNGYWLPTLRFDWRLLHRSSFIDESLARKRLDRNGESPGSSVSNGTKKAPVPTRVRKHSRHLRPLFQLASLNARQPKAPSPGRARSRLQW